MRAVRHNHDSRGTPSGIPGSVDGKQGTGVSALRVMLGAVSRKQSAHGNPGTQLSLSRDEPSDIIFGQSLPAPSAEQPLEVNCVHAS